MSVSLLPNAKQQFLDGTGTPLALGFVYFYIPSTSTFKDTWSNAAGTVLNTNPVILDAAGEAIIYGSGQYRQLLTDSLGNTIWDQITESALQITDLSITAGDASITVDPDPLEGIGTIIVTDHGITNTKLAAMPTNTLKGNNSGSTAEPVDLTATQTTAMLNVFVGDTGSGGTKGLVPAPAAGDTAAGKFLTAGGGFGPVVAGTGLNITGAGAVALNVGSGLVGTYAYLYQNVGSFNPGDTTAGSNLRYAGIGINSVFQTGGLISGAAPSGTWQCMGYSPQTPCCCCGPFGSATIWIRIA